MHHKLIPKKFLFNLYWDLKIFYIYTPLILSHEHKATQDLEVIMNYVDSSQMSFLCFIIAFSTSVLFPPFT